MFRSGIEDQRVMVLHFIRNLIAKLGKPLRILIPVEGSNDHLCGFRRE